MTSLCSDAGSNRDLSALCVVGRVFVSEQCSTGSMSRLGR